MKKKFLLMALVAISQFGFAQKQSYTSNFSSVNQIRKYLADNILNLDPAEGEYDVQITVRTGSPFAPNDKVSGTFFVVKAPSANTLTIYNDEYGYGFSKSNGIRIESIGETNAYRVYYRNSSSSAYLENGVRLYAQINLSTSDARHFTGNPDFSYWITVSYDMVKKYPTSSMYANAAKEIVEKTQPIDWSGTGFALKNNYIVTNYHVIEDAKTINIQGVNGEFKTKYNASVVASDKFNDLAILKVEGVSISTIAIPYSIKTSTSEVGEDIFVLGFPLTSTMGEEIKLSTGVVSSRTGFQGDVSLYQISAPIQPGNSGGPLFDNNGNVIGIVSAKHKGAENVGYAIKASYLRNLMESALSENILPQTNKVTNYKLSDKVKSLKNYVYYITCSKTDNNVSTSVTTNNNVGSTYSPEKIYNNPHINRNMSLSLKVLSVKIQGSQTVITFSNNNKGYDGGYYQWVTMNEDAYISVKGQKYTLIKADGITIAPDKTYYSYAGETKTFTLYFPAIPKDATSIDFIESEGSDWRLYGIQLR